MLVAPSASSASLALAAPYAVSAVPFAPEAAPTGNNGPICDDCVMFNVPLGFDFAFFGVAYSTLNISSNGFVGFGSSLGNGCCKGGMIPSNDVTNNIIALGWSDWRPQLVPGGIKYETRGEAPNRRFVLQFNNVPDRFDWAPYDPLVLHERPNDIEIHTTVSVRTQRPHHNAGVENSTGLLAASLPAAYAPSSRSRRTVSDSRRRRTWPVLSVPGTSRWSRDWLVLGHVDVGSATATDDTEGFEISARERPASARRPYPAGVTTIVWTVKDAGGLKASADQQLRSRTRKLLRSLPRPIVGQQRARLGRR